MEWKAFKTKNLIGDFFPGDQRVEEGDEAHEGDQRCGDVQDQHNRR